MWSFNVSLKVISSYLFYACGYVAAPTAEKGTTFLRLRVSGDPLFQGIISTLFSTLAGICQNIGKVVSLFCSCYSPTFRKPAQNTYPPIFSHYIDKRHPQTIEKPLFPLQKIVLKFCQTLFCVLQPSFQWSESPLKLANNVNTAFSLIG